MSVTVLNTDAGVSGKTLVTAEGTHTIDGLHTFDRDPNAPFAVAAGSAVVTNLDADKLDGSEGSSYVHKTNDAVWTAFTPTWTNLSVGNGSASAKYMQIGKIVFYKIFLLFGSTTSVSGLITASLPATSIALGNSVTTGGSYLAYDSGSAAYYSGTARLATTTTLELINQAAPMTSTSSTVPFTWASADQLYITGSYEAA